MASHVHYKFLSAKEPTRVTFDGTSISVFNLKREIMRLSSLGEGHDIELEIKDESTKEGMLWNYKLLISAANMKQCTMMILQKSLGRRLCSQNVCLPSSLAKAVLHDMSAANRLSTRVSITVQHR